MTVEWKDRIVQYPRRYQLVEVDAVNKIYDLVVVTGTVTEEGTPVNAVNMNAIEDAIADVKVVRGARVGLSVNYTPEFSTNVLLPFDTEDFDDLSFHDNVTNNTRLTIPSGVNQVRLRANIAFMGSGRPLIAKMLKNGGSARGLPSFYINDDGDSSSKISADISLCSGLLNVVAGDYFEIQIRTNTNVAGRNVTASDYTWFEIEVIN